MHKRTLLLPTDFSIESLHLLKHAVGSVEVGSVNIILAHGIHLSDSIFDLLFYSKKETLDSLLSHDFRSACSVVLNKFSSSINSFRIEIFTGSTQAAFQNFMEGNRVDGTLVPKTYTFKFESKRSFDLLPFIHKSAFPTTEIDWPLTKNVPEKNQLAEIFLL